MPDCETAIRCLGPGWSRSQDRAVIHALPGLTFPCTREQNHTGRHAHVGADRIITWED